MTLPCKLSMFGKGIKGPSECTALHDILTNIMHSWNFLIEIITQISTWNFGKMTYNLQYHWLKNNICLGIVYVCSVFVPTPSSPPPPHTHTQSHEHTRAWAVRHLQSSNAFTWECTPVCCIPCIKAYRSLTEQYYEELMVFWRERIQKKENINASFHLLQLLYLEI